MLKSVLKKVSLQQSEDQSISDWASLSHLQRLEIGHALRLQYMYTYNLNALLDKTQIVIRKLGQES